MREVKVYECEHCGKKRYKLKSSAVRHEKKCYWNPETKSCMSCQNYLAPNDETVFKVVVDNTVCVYANCETLLNYNCEGWKLVDYLEDCDEHS